MKMDIQMILQYEIKPDVQLEYVHAMDKVLNTMSQFEVCNIQWHLITSSKNHYMEIFSLPTESHYYALKKLRTANHHSIFGKLDDYIEGGIKSMDVYALRRNIR